MPSSVRRYVMSVRFQNTLSAAQKTPDGHGDEAALNEDPGCGFDDSEPRY